MLYTQLLSTVHTFAMMDDPWQVESSVALSWPAVQWPPDMGPLIRVDPQYNYLIPGVCGLVTIAPYNTVCFAIKSCNENLRRIENIQLVHRQDYEA